MANGSKLGQARCYADVLIDGPNGESIFEGAIIPFASVSDGNEHLDTALTAENITIWTEEITLLETQHLDTVTNFMVPDIERTRTPYTIWSAHIDCFREV